MCCLYPAKLNVALLLVMLSGWVDSKGPRYCPSIEDKIVRFADKSSHQIFLEPEGRNTPELYVQVCYVCACVCVCVCVCACVCHENSNAELNSAQTYTYTQTNTHKQTHTNTHRASPQACQSAYSLHCCTHCQVLSSARC